MTIDLDLRASKLHTLSIPVFDRSIIPLLNRITTLETYVDTFCAFLSDFYFLLKSNRDNMGMGVNGFIRLPCTHRCFSHLRALR